MDIIFYNLKIILFFKKLTYILNIIILYFLINKFIKNVFPIKYTYQKIEYLIQTMHKI